MAGSRRSGSGEVHGPRFPGLPVCPGSPTSCFAVLFLILSVFVLPPWDSYALSIIINGRKWWPWHMLICVSEDWFKSSSKCLASSPSEVVNFWLSKRASLVPRSACQIWLIGTISVSGLRQKFGGGWHWIQLLRTKHAVKGGDTYVRDPLGSECWVPSCLCPSQSHVHQTREESSPTQVNRIEKQDHFSLSLRRENRELVFLTWKENYQRGDHFVTCRNIESLSHALGFNKALGQLYFHKGKENYWIFFLFF